jgi:hypothetical protein
MVGELSANIYVFDARDNLPDTRPYSMDILGNPLHYDITVMDFTRIPYRRIRRESFDHAP